MSEGGEQHGIDHALRSGHDIPQEILESELIASATVESIKFSGAKDPVRQPNGQKPLTALPEVVHTGSPISARAARAQEILQPENWPTPEWYTRQRHNQRQNKRQN